MQTQKVRRRRLDANRRLTMKLIKERLSELGFYIFDFTHQFENHPADFLAVENRFLNCEGLRKVVTVGLARDNIIVVRPYWRMELYELIRSDLRTIFIRKPNLERLYHWGPQHVRSQYPEQNGWLRFISRNQRSKAFELLGQSKLD